MSDNHEYRIAKLEEQVDKLVELTKCLEEAPPRATVECEACRVYYNLHGNYNCPVHETRLPPRSKGRGRDV